MLFLEILIGLIAGLIQVIAVLPLPVRLGLDIVLAVIPAFIALYKGRNFLTWWLYGVLLWPVALVHVLVTRPNGKPCPRCSEHVMRKSATCPYCLLELPREWRETSSARHAIRSVV